MTHAESIKERIALYSKLLMLAPGIAVIDVGGISGVVATQNDRVIFEL